MAITTGSQSGEEKAWTQISVTSTRQPAWLRSSMAVCEQRGLGISPKKYCIRHKIPLPDFLKWDRDYSLFYKGLTDSLLDSVIYSPGMIVGVALMRGTLPENSYLAMLQVRILLERIDLPEATHLGQSLVSATTAYGAPGRAWKELVALYVNPPSKDQVNKIKKPTRRTRKYAWLTKYIENDVLYSPAGVVNAAQEGGEPLLNGLSPEQLEIIRVKIRHSLTKLIKGCGFGPDGRVRYAGHHPYDAYLGRNWIKVLRPFGDPASPVFEHGIS